MKVDIIVNSMIQQIDRNLQTQLLPPLSFRPGELLRGRVMLSTDDRPQIRLDNGTLLDALPAGDVMLNAGATVTLRVSGRVDGQLVMQLMEQEITGGQAVPPSGEAGANASLAKLGLNSTPQGKAVIRAMEGMNLPLREETVRQAMDILAVFPDLEPEKAAFMVANRLPATQAQVKALNSLVDGATTGGELIKLADILSSQALETENIGLAENFESTSPSAGVPEGAIATAQPAESAQEGPKAKGQPAEEAETPAAQSGAAGKAAQETGRAANTSVPYPGGAAKTEALVIVPYEADLSDWAEAPAEVPEGSEDMPFISARSVPSMQTQASPPGGDGVQRLQSLVFVALGMEASEKYSGAIAVLDEKGMAGQAAALALDAPFIGQEEFTARLQALVAALPQGEAPEARDFVVKLADGLKNYIRANGPEMPSLSQAGGQSEGIPRFVRLLADMFVKLDGVGADPGESLAKAASEQKAKIAHISSEVGKSVDIGLDARQQLSRVENHVRLIDDISQYAYRQIPVQMNNRNRTVEIYVLNRKGGGKRIKADNANILIALDTENLGHIETLINVSNKNLRLRFGVERPGLVGYVGSFAADIGEALKEIGYRLSDLRTEVAARKTTPLTVAETVGETGKQAAALDIRL